MMNVVRKYCTHLLYGLDAAPLSETGVGGGCVDAVPWSRHAANADQSGNGGRVSRCCHRYYRRH